jgi:cytochrome P450
LERHITKVFSMLNFRLFFPVPYWRWFKLAADRRLERSLIELNHAVSGFIAQARERMRARPELFDEPENFLEAMLAAQRADGAFTDEEIVGNTFTLLIAGEDTTSHTMAWTSWFLAQRPDVQARWAQEAQQALGDELVPTDHELVSRLPYGEAVLRESMRLKSVANGIAVLPRTDTTICDTHIPAGTRVILETRYIATRASGAEYRPERWLGDGERAPLGEASGEAPGETTREAPRQASRERETPDQKTFLAFGAGPRFCPGRNLAFLESKTAMATIARSFELELDDTRGPVTERLSFTMIPVGLRVRVRERAPQSPAAAAMPVGADT